MDFSTIIDINAFSRGLASATMSLGLVIPVAAADYIGLMIRGYTGGTPYLGNLIQSGVDIWKYAIMTNKS